MELDDTFDGSAAQESMPTERDVARVLKIRGLAHVRADAIATILRQLKHEHQPQTQLCAIVEAIITLAERKGDDFPIDASCIRDVVGIMSRDDDDVCRDSIQIVAAFATPKHSYDATRRSYYYEGAAFSLHAGPEAKLALTRDRFALLLSRVMRNALFTPPLPGAAAQGQFIPLTPLEQLAGVEKGQRVTMLGMLTQPEDGVWCVEDAHKSVAVEMAAAAWQDGLYTESCIVLVSGVYDSDATCVEVDAARVRGEDAPPHIFLSLADGRLPGVFRVHSMCHPPMEGRDATMRAMALVDPYRVHDTPADVSRAYKLMMGMSSVRGAASGLSARKYADGMVAVLSNVHLDKASVLHDLTTMLDGFDHMPTPPLMLILMGDFCSHAFGQYANDRDTFRRLFDELAVVFSAFPHVLSRMHVVVIPGPNDPGSAAVLPRSPIPAFFLNRLASPDVCPTFTSTTNPCRLRYFTQDILLFRQDVSRRLRRASMVPPSGDGSIHEHVVTTLLHQAHVCPLPLSQQPVYWAHDHALRVHPLPHMLVIAEDLDPYCVGDAEDDRPVVVNPGSFAEDGVFTILRPARCIAEESSIPRQTAPSVPRPVVVAEHCVDAAAVSAAVNQHDVQPDAPPHEVQEDTVMLDADDDAPASETQHVDAEQDDDVEAIMNDMLGDDAPAVVDDDDAASHASERARRNDGAAAEAMDDADAGADALAAAVATQHADVYDDDVIATS